MKKKNKRSCIKGYDAGFNKSYPIGWQQGVLACTQTFPGTSIILSVFNQKEMLRQCLESIFAYTTEPHEIIVIDNGSTDGTDRYLNSLSGRVVSKCLKRHMGLASGLNQGLRMARGEYLLLLDPAMTATCRWLSNLLACHRDYPGHGIVGPVSNGLSGDQKLDTDYAGTVQMQQFAEGHNVSKPDQWVETKGLSGLCILMSRDVYRRLGYLDEGLDIGSFAVDDYGLRAQMLNIPLVIARDTFIHHAGNPGAYMTGNLLDEKYRRNLTYYGSKWGDHANLLSRFKNAREQVRGFQEFLPSHVIVKGVGETRYWLEYGIRHPIEDAGDLDAVRLSQIELRNCPAGPVTTRNDVSFKLAMLSATPSPYGSIAEGVLVKDGNGSLFQSVKGTLRPLIGERAREAWQLGKRPVYGVAEETLSLYPIGIPILAPPVVLSENL